MRALLIGRFQPFHNGHLMVIKEIIGQGIGVVVGIGSAQYNHTPDNPFTAEERTLMIERSLELEGVDDYTIVNIPDIHNYPIWVAHLESLVPPFDMVYTKSSLTKRLFTEAGREIIEPYLYDREKYSGTEVRRRLIAGEDWQELVPEGTRQVIEEIDGVSRLGSMKEKEG